jgi:hypothetical protein
LDSIFAKTQNKKKPAPIKEQAFPLINANVIREIVQSLFRELALANTEDTIG